MKSNLNTTYILLERGAEDIALLKEIDAVIDRAGMFALSKEAARRYPTLMELRHKLKQEAKEQS